VALGPPPVRTFPTALACALRGLRHAARTQRHFRAQLVIAAGALLFAAWARVTTVELVLLAITVGLVLGAELLNTAMEMLTDLLHPDHGPAAAAVKDVSAAAVLAAAVVALGVGLVVLLPRIIPASSDATRGVAVALSIACLIVLAVGAMPHRTAPHP
jgi:diacylglycerol kinase